MLSISVTAPGTVGTVGTPVSMVGFQLGTGLTAQLPGTANAGDGVQFYGANISNATSLAQLSPISNLVIGPGTPENNGLAPSQPGSGLTYLYLYAVRTLVVTAGTVTATVAGQETTGTNGGSSNPNAILQNGNAFGAPITIGSTDAQSLSLEANSVVGYAQLANGDLTLGTATASSTTSVQTGAGGTIDIGTGSGAAIAVAIGGIGSSVANIFANVAAGGSINIANGTANQTVNVGSTSGASLTTVQGGTSGVAVTATGVGPVVVTGGTGASSFVTTTTGTLTLNSGTTGDVNVGTGLAGVDANAKTVRLGTGAATKTILIGSSSGASSAQILAATGGIGIGVAAPGSGGVSIDGGPASTILLGTVNATQVNIAGAASATVNIAQTGAGATVNIGNTGAGTQVAINVGTGGFSVLGTGVATASITTGTTGALTLDSGTTGAINVGTNANAKTITVGNVTGATTVAVNAGTGGVKLTATGVGNVTLVPGATGNVQMNAAASATCGVQLGIPVAVTDKAGGGTIGANTVTVDIASVIEVNQTTGAQTLTVPNPTVTTQARLLYIINIGSADFTLLASTVKAIGAGSKSMTCLIWSPGATRWVPTVIT